MASENETVAEPSPKPAKDTDAVDLGMRSRDIVPVVLMITAVLAALSGQKPTGTLFSDIVLTAAFAAGVVWISRYARGEGVLLSACLALFFTGFQLPALLTGIIAVPIAFAVTTWRKFDTDSWQIGVAVATALTTFTALQLPNVGFNLSASLLAAIALAPVVVTGLQNLPERFRRPAKLGLLGCVAFCVVATALAVLTALSARSSLEDGIAFAESGITAVEAGNTEEALQLLAAAEDKLSGAADRLSGPLTMPARLVPITAQHSRALEAAAEQGALLASSATRTVTRADVEAIRGSNGAIDVQLIQNVNVELNNAAATMTTAQLALSEVQTPWLVTPVTDRLTAAQLDLSDAANDINLAQQGTAVLPGILGSEGQRRYLILFVQPAEAREFGGFIGAYGILEANNGQVELTESGSIDVDLGLNRAFFTNPDDFPTFYKRIAPNANPQNLTGIADLSTVAAAAADLVPQWRGDPDFTIDGVLTIDPYALAGLLELTGPIQVEGRPEPIDASNVANFLLREQYEQFEILERDSRQDLLKVLAAEAFNRLLTLEAPGPERLGAVFGPIARANRISFTTFDDDENAFLERVFLSADLPSVEPSVDMLGIFTGTGTASKLDAYATRSTTYVVSIDPATGAYSGNVEVTLANNVPTTAPEYVLGRDVTGLDRAPVTPGTHLIALSVYAHQEVTNMASTTPFAPRAAEPSLGYARTWLAVEVPPQATSTVTFDTAGVALPGRYDLVLPPAQTAQNGQFTLVIQPTDGWRVVAPDTAPDGSWTTTVSTELGNGFRISFERPS